MPVEEKGQGTAAVNAGFNKASTYTVKYDEGLEVGYKWYDARNKPVLFPFGFGLSYTTFTYSGLRVTPSAKPQASFTVKNTGKTAGAEVVELYAGLPAATHEPPQRLVGYSKLALQPGESREVTLDVDPLFLAVYDEAAKRMMVAPGEYTFAAGPSSRTLPLQAKVMLAGAEVSH